MNEEYKQPNCDNVNKGDIFLSGSNGRIIPFSIKTANRIMFSSEKVFKIRELKTPIGILYEDAAILTQKGELLLGENCKYDPKIYENFIEQNFGMLLRKV